MFSSNCDPQQSRSVSDIMGPSGIPKPKSLLSSFLGLSPQSQEGPDRHQPQHRPQTLSLQTNLLPSSLLGDSFHDLRSPRPRTVTDDTVTDDSTPRIASLLMPPPHRTWSIASSDDHKALPKVPSHYPPFDPNCTALVTDAPPSVVVVRISECLRRRSISVEYDDESVTARCMTVDRLHFMIQLYRAPAVTREESPDEISMMAPPHDAVIVEIRKITGGSSMSFHSACSKILGAAKGLETGDDERPPHRRNGVEFPPRSIAKRRHPSSVVSSDRSIKRRRLPLLETLPSRGAPSDRSSIAEESLEAAMALLQKDRLECQRLGMERLVNLTTGDIVGNEICRYVSRRLLLQEHPKEGNPGSLDESTESSSTNRWRLIDCLLHPGAEQASKEVPDAKESPKKSTSTANAANRTITPVKNQSKNDRMIRSFLESPALTVITPLSKKHSSSRSTSFLKMRSHKRASSSDSDAGTMTPEELRHEARLRSLGLRVFCNALDSLSNTKELTEVLHPSQSHQPKLPSRWVTPAVLLSLVQDLLGASRPHSVAETGYKLASVHEAALAARCLRLLAGYGSEENPEGPDTTTKVEEEHEVVRTFLRSEAVLERLEHARSCGRVTHAMLHYEAELTYSKLTEDDRSC